jgi:hypothetical protein
MSGARSIRLPLADVDGTLLTKDKGAAKEAARELHQRARGLDGEVRRQVRA